MKTKLNPQKTRSNIIKLTLMTYLTKLASSSYLGTLTNFQTEGITSYKGKYKNLTKEQITGQKSPLHSSTIKVKKTEIQGNKIQLDILITFFYEEDPFSDGLHLNFVTYLDKDNRAIDYQRLAKYDIGYVGSDQLLKYDQAFVKVNSSNLTESFNFFPNSEILIESNFNTRENNVLELEVISEKIDYKFQYLSYLFLLVLLFITQFVSAVVLCHKGINEKLNFVRKLPLIPVVQSWAMDFTLILTTWQYFQVYALVYKIQLVLAILGIPLLFKYFLNLNLFTGRSRIKKHSIFWLLILLVLSCNIMVLTVFSNKVSYACVMLMLSFILEGIVFNKKHQHLWFFWSYMVPKSLIMFYIYYYPYNLLLNPIDIKDFSIIILTGGVLFGLILLQKFWSPRFGILTDGERRMKRYVPRVMSIEEILNEKEKDKNKHFLEDFCAICWVSFDQDEHSNNNQVGINEESLKIEKEEILMETGCGHIFHKECLDAWVKKQRKCPTCRGKIIIAI